MDTTILMRTLSCPVQTNTPDIPTTAAVMATHRLSPKKTRRAQGTLSHSGPACMASAPQSCPHCSPEPALPPTSLSSATWHSHQLITEPLPRHQLVQICLDICPFVCFKSDPIYIKDRLSALTYKALCGFCKWQH